ncbi:MAG: hypothetical protein AAGG01_24650, partial [Planctomycetota bacterium]
MLYTTLLMGGLALPTALPQSTPAQRLDTRPVMAREIVSGPVGPDGRQLPSYMASQVLVRFSAGVEAAALGDVLGGATANRYGVERVVASQLNLHLVQILDGTNVGDAMEELNAQPGVLYAVPDHVVTNRDTFPNDGQFNQQYGKHNTGQTGGTNDADIDAPKAWDYSTGTSEFAVAIVDGGVDHDKEDPEAALQLR